MNRLIKDSWVMEYMRYAHEQEAPDEFHFWVALFTVSAALQRNVSLNMGYFKIYPNFYIFLIGPSALTRKSTAIKMGTWFIERLETPPCILSESITPQAIIRSLAKWCKTETDKDGVKRCTRDGFGVLYSSELEVSIPSELCKKELLPLLIDMWDCKEGRPWQRETIGRGLEKVYNPGITMIAGTTVSGLMGVLPSSALPGGFASRVIFMRKDSTPKSNPFPVVTAKSVEQQERLLHDLNEISKLKGSFTIAKDAKQHYIKWYNKVQQQGAKVETYLQGFIGRKQVYALKIAIILSVSQRDDLVLTLENVEGAIGILESFEASILNVSRQLDMSEFGKMVDFVQHQIIAAGGIVSRSRLTKRVTRRLNLAEMDAVLDVLIESGAVKVEMLERGKRVYKVAKDLGG